MINGMPPLLLGVVILFWGQQTGLWVVALPAAILAEAHRGLRRWELSDTDFTRLSYFCTIVIIVISIYLYATRATLGSSVMTTVQWFHAA